MSIAATNPASASAALSSLLGGQSGGGSTAAPASAADQSDRFLKLLVTQMQNQDPLNPMDNAQVTSQMAQISTVSGIDKLNTTIQQMTSMMLQSQTLQGAALVGKSVLIAGNDLHPDAKGAAGGGFDLASAADSVVVSVADAAGRVVDTIPLGAQAAGQHSFDWQAPARAAGPFTFSVSAKAGAQSVAATTLAADQVSAVHTGGTGLAIELKNRGVVDFSDVRAVH